MERIVKITWDKPEEYEWLCPDNIKSALQVYCKNTQFKVEDYKQEKTGYCKEVDDYYLENN